MDAAPLLFLDHFSTLPSSSGMVEGENDQEKVEVWHPCMSMCTINIMCL